MKTPLTVISANAEILALSNGENEWCEGIARQANTMRNLINQMIRMAKLDENDSVLTVEQFSLTDAVYDAVTSFEVLAAQRGLRLHMEIEPALCMDGDEAAVRQVAAILMDNAVKYCDADGEISVTLYGTGRKGGATLSVSNPYAAVDTVDLPCLFDRFYRCDQARENTNSFGLGLSIARSIMEQHKGSLNCYKDAEKHIRFAAEFKRLKI